MIEFTSRQVRALLLVAQHRSFTRAAAALFVTPSAVSVLIRELETQLGVRLFDRTTRQVALTASGTELVAVAQRNLQEFDNALSRISRSAAGNHPTLCVGAPPSVVAILITQAIKAFRSQRTDIQFHISDADTVATMHKIESGSLDIGLGFFFKHSPGIRRIPLFRFSLIVIRAPGGRASSRSTITWSALKGEKIISLQPDFPLQQFVDKHLARAGVAYQPALVLNYLNTQIAMVEAGEGVAIVPSFVLPECRSRRLLINRLTNPAVHLDLYLVRRGGRKLSSAAEEFTSFLRTYVAEWARRPGVLS